MQLSRTTPTALLRHHAQSATPTTLCPQTTESSSGLTLTDTESVELPGSPELAKVQQRDATDTSHVRQLDNPGNNLPSGPHGQTLQNQTC
jgi:hypothetical protein